MENKKAVLRKLFQIQQELKAPKGQRNNFGRYQYRSCEDVLQALKPILKKNNCVIILNDEIVVQESTGETTKTTKTASGITKETSTDNRFYVKVSANLFDIETGESISAEAFAREENKKKGMDGSQLTGSTSSYARKYALSGLFGIDDEKDSDSTNKK